MILDADGAIRSLREVVFEKGPDYVYRRVEAYGFQGACVNFTEDGEPSCIVGHVFGLLGLTGEKALEVGVASTAIASVSCELLNRSDFEWTFTDGAIRILAVAQDYQDTGSSWGEALEACENVFHGLAADK